VAFVTFCRVQGDSSAQAATTCPARWTADTLCCCGVVCSADGMGASLFFDHVNHVMLSKSSNIKSTAACLGVCSGLASFPMVQLMYRHASLGAESCISQAGASSECSKTTNRPGEWCCMQRGPSLIVLKSAVLCCRVGQGQGWSLAAGLKTDRACTQIRWECTQSVCCLRTDATTVRAAGFIAGGGFCWYASMLNVHLPVMSPSSHWSRRAG
jgi:hypothetical protein